jgi:hypothetical protein
VDGNVETVRPLTICSDQKIEILLIDFGTFVVIEWKPFWLFPGYIESKSYS